jgi:hypothetical protein
MWTPRLLLALLAAALTCSACFRRPCGSSTVLGGAVPVLDARFSVASCCGGPRYVWNGSACTEVRGLTLCGCDCSGRDCDKVFSSLVACERAYDHCR